MERPVQRRSVLASLVGAGTLSLAGCTDAFASGLEPLEGWPSYRYDAANSGRNPDATGPRDDLEVAWEHDLELPGSEFGPSVVSHPIVLGDWVIAAYDFEVGADRETRLVAVDRETGEREWIETFELAPDEGSERLVAPGNTLESDGERVYLVTLEGEQVLRSFDPETGSENWRSTLDQPLYAPATATGGSLYAGERTYAVFEAADGSLERRYEWERDDSVLAWVNQFPPTVTEDVVFAAVADELRATDRSDGSVLWRAESPFESRTYEDGGAWFNQPVVGDGVVYATTGDVMHVDYGGIVALSDDDGGELWSHLPDRAERDPDADVQEGIAAAMYGLPLVFEETNTVCAYGEERSQRKLFGFEAENGDVRWDVDEVGSISLVAADGIVYTFDEEGVVAIDHENGDVIGTGTVDSDGPFIVAHSPAVVDDHLYVNTGVGVIAFGP